MDVHFMLLQMMTPTKAFAALFANVFFLLRLHVGNHVVLQFNTRRKKFMTMGTRKLLRMHFITMRCQTNGTREKRPTDFAFDLPMVSIMMFLQAMYIG
eukprot:02035.XXX_22100_22393_1 [CDS] Oithona nana genome sequencing.